MLLCDLINLLSEELNVNGENVKEIMVNSKIRINQRLLMENVEEKKEKRGRGRPKKNCVITSKDEESIEVEIVKIDNVKYYKTEENVLLNEKQDIIGMLIDGKIEKRNI